MLHALSCWDSGHHRCFCHCGNDAALAFPGTDAISIQVARGEPSDTPQTPAAGIQQDLNGWFEGGVFALFGDTPTRGAGAPPNTPAHGTDAHASSPYSVPGAIASPGAFLSSLAVPIPNVQGLWNTAAASARSPAAAGKPPPSDYTVLQDAMESAGSPPQRCSTGTPRSPLGGSARRAAPSEWARAARENGAHQHPGGEDPPKRLPSTPGSEPFRAECEELRRVALAAQAASEREAQRSAAMASAWAEEKDVLKGELGRARRELDDALEELHENAQAAEQHLAAVSAGALHACPLSARETALCQDQGSSPHARRRAR